MGKYQMEQLPSTVSSSLSIACACFSCILLLLLDVELAESRLIWIPRAKDVNQGASKYTKVVNANDHKTDKTSLKSKFEDEAKIAILKDDEYTPIYSSIDKLCESRFSKVHNNSFISENKQTFSQSFYSRLNHLIEKALSTYSKECQHRKSPASILIKVLTKKSASIKSRRHIEETNRCKNIKMVLRYAHRLLC